MNNLECRNHVTRSLNTVGVLCRTIPKGLATAAISISIFLAACGDDNKNAGGTVEDQEIIAITDKTISGVSQKGPFVNGSSVTVQELDGETLAQTGNSYEGKIKNDMGEFSVKVTKLASQYALLKANGFYRNEVTGEKSKSQVTLYALTDISNRDEVNVNLLTHLEYERSLYLAADDSVTVAAAKKQAEKEVLATFGITGDFANSEDLNIFGTDDGAAALLAVSVLMQGNLSEADFSERLADYAADIETDGKWGDTKTATKIADWASSKSLGGELENIRNNIAKWDISTDVPAFEKYVYNFWWQNYGLGTCDKKRNGEVLQNTNKQSYNRDIYYICKNDLWVPANDLEKDSVSFWSSAADLTIKIGSVTGKVYMYDEDHWRQLDEKVSISVEKPPVPIDYALGRTMNARLGKGINLGNSWESSGNDDCGWGNPIKDEDFAVIKATGFNSVRLPVRWQRNSDYSSHTVDPERLAGVKEDIELALAQGLAVIVNFHHYIELNEAGNNYTTDPTSFNAEKDHFLQLWAQVATELNEYPDSMIVFEILNEPTISNVDLVNQIMNEAHSVIRKAAPGKTIMFEAYHAAKFAELKSLQLPKDGNIIYSGHYYEPYTYSHQGHSYSCKGDEAYANNAFKDFRGYLVIAKLLYPDVNGGHVPMNMGEFGISGGTEFANDNTCVAGESLPSAKMKAQWTKETIMAAEKYDISWHYWGFTRVGGFEAYDRNNDSWYDGFPEAFGL